MLTTEEEATKKTCQETSLSENCIGSACMAWRWYNREFIDGMLSALEAIENYNSIHPQNPPFGYCGKAGRP